MLPVLTKKAIFAGDENVPFRLPFLHFNQSEVPLPDWMRVVSWPPVRDAVCPVYHF
jgi:hypothetical protein